MEEKILKNFYTVKTPQYEGPYNLLLHLIEERKLFINDISLSQVTEDYLNYINGFKNLETSQISSFVVVAATLILIKSKSLLPNLDLSKEEEGSIKDLEDRLKLYDFYLKLSLNIKNNFGKNIIFPPLDKKNYNVVFLPNEQISKESVRFFINEIIKRIPKKVILQEVEVKKVISLEEMIEKLTERITKSISMNFKDLYSLSGKINNEKNLIKNKEEKIFVIVGFLAMLELVRGGILNAMQNNNFEDIIIKQHRP
ncbi:MAG: ScpA family protein [Patescibacteria group bacterium]